MDCQLKYLARCSQADLKRALNGLPASLDETYERTLSEIEDTNWEDARRLLQCVAVASRPLRVEELADILAFDFSTGPIPKICMDRYLEGPGEAVLSICSTLLSLVNVENSRVIQFGHHSVKEFLTSTRFSRKCDTISRRYHISMSPAHTVIAQACLGILLHLPKNITDDSLIQYPLAGYASEHWFEHARVEDVSHHVIEGMKQLFDRTKPHFSIWLWICNPTISFEERRRTLRAQRPFTPRGTPLHYATFCGLRDVVMALAIGSQDVNSPSFSNELTPLHLASREGHLHIAWFLIQYGANGAYQDGDGSSPVHLAFFNGHLKLAQLLVEHCANTAAQDQHGSTPLHQASKRGHLDLARFIVKHGADPAAQDHRGLTPLHQASQWGHLDLAQFLVEHGANVVAQDQGGWTPLHKAAEQGHPDLARFLVKHGANTAAQDQHGSTPLHKASELGHPDLARFLVKHGANPADQDEDGSTPIHLAFFNGHLKLAQLLVEHCANTAAQDQHGSTPLHLASKRAHLDLAQFLVEHGANVAAQDQGGWTPLHETSSNGHLSVARLLVKHGADVVTSGKTQNINPR